MDRVSEHILGSSVHLKRRLNPKCKHLFRFQVKSPLLKASGQKPPDHKPPSQKATKDKSPSPNTISPENEMSPDTLSLSKQFAPCDKLPPLIN